MVSLKRFFPLYIAYASLLFSGGMLSAQNAGSPAGNMPPFDTVRAVARLDSVAVTGIDSLPPVESDGLRDVILSAAGEDLNEGLIEHDVNAIEAFLRERGWWNARVTALVDSSAGRPAMLTFSANPGALVRFGRLSTESDNNEADIPGIPLPELFGQPFTKDILELIINDVVMRCAGNGYPDATVKPLLTTRIPDQVGDTIPDWIGDVKLSIHAGNRAHIDSIVVRGLARTKDYVVLRELNSLRGMPAGPEALRETRAVVRQLTFLRASGSPYIDYAPDGTCELVLDIEEKGLGSFDGVLGYQPAAGSESPTGSGRSELIGKIDLDVINLFGSGQSSNIRWEKLGTRTEDLELMYQEPRIYKMPFGISGRFLQEERGQIGYTKTRFDVKLNQRYLHLEINTGLRYEKVSADSLTSSGSQGLEAGILWTDVDDSDNPRSGMSYAGTWSVLSKKYRFGAKDRVQINHAAIDLDHYIPALPRQTVAIIIRYRRVHGDCENLDPADRYWLGGASSIRGYRERMFPAVEALWGSLEYRFLTGGTSRFFFFVDSGHLVDYVRSSDFSYHRKAMTRTGYGLGLRLQTRSGTLGFDYGLGQGDNPGQGKLHVRLSAEF